MKKTSVPEQAILFYIRKHVDPNAENNSVRIGRYCADITFTFGSKLYNIEYDSFSQHNGREDKDCERNNVFSQYGYTVIRMRDRNLPFVDNCHCIRFDFQDYRIHSLQKANEGINELLSFFGIEASVDIAQDLGEIKKMYACFPE